MFCLLYTYIFNSKVTDSRKDQQAKVSVIRQATSVAEPTTVGADEFWRGDRVPGVVQRGTPLRQMDRLPEDGTRKRLDGEHGGPGVVARFREGLCPLVDADRLIWFLFYLLRETKSHKQI